MLKNIIIAGVILILAGFAIYQSVSGTGMPTEEAPKPQFLTPSFELEGLDGKNYATGDQGDKALLINFWASWCEPCQEEAPDLVKLYEKYGDDLEIYGVNVFILDQMDNLKAFVDQYQLPFPILIDRDGVATRKYRVRAYPTNVLVDRRGVVQEVITGIKPFEEMERKIEALID